MNLRRLLFLVTVLGCAFMPRGFAVIGDDLPQLRQRYGSAQEQLNGVLFSHNNFAITVFFDANHSAMEVFGRDAHAKDQSPLSLEEVEKILELEGKGQLWGQALTQKGLPVWIRQDHKLLARISYEEGKRVLVVMMNEK